MIVEGFSSFSLHNTAKQGIQEIRLYTAHCSENRPGPASAADDPRLKMKKPQKPSPLAAAASPLFLFSKDLFLYDVPMSDSAVSRVISFSDVLFHRRLSFCRDSHSHRSAWTIYQNVRASPERTSDQPRSRSYVQQSCAAAYVV